MEPVESPAAHLAHGRLTTVDCVAQSLAVGPIFSAAAIGAILASLSGGVSPFVVILTTIGILGIGYCVAEFARRYSGSGTVYEFVAHTLGKRPAVFTAGAYHFAALTLGGPGIGIIVGIQAHLFFDAHTGIDIPWWVWGLFFSVIITLVNIVGVQFSVRTQLTIIGLSLVPFIILIVAVLADGGPNGLSLESFNPANVAAGGSVFKGLLFAHPHVRRLRAGCRAGRGDGGSQAVDPSGRAGHHPDRRHLLPRHPVRRRDRQRWTERHPVRLRGAGRGVRRAMAQRPHRAGRAARHHRGRDRLPGRRLPRPVHAGP